MKQKILSAGESRKEHDALSQANCSPDNVHRTRQCKRKIGDAALALQPNANEDTFERLIIGKPAPGVPLILNFQLTWVEHRQPLPCKRLLNQIADGRIAQDHVVTHIM